MNKPILMVFLYCAFALTMLSVGSALFKAPADAGEPRLEAAIYP